MADFDLLNIKPNIVDPSLSGKIVWFYGAPGTRKTTVASKFPKPLLAATERGYKFINGVKAVDIKSWSDVRHLVRQLKDEQVQALYETIVWDRADTLYDYCKDYICKTQGVRELSEIAYSAGYTLARKEFASVIRTVESLGYGMVFITHDKVNMEKQTTQDLENNAAKVIRGYADFTFLLKKEVIDDRETVIAYSQKAGAESKSRAMYFAESFEFTFENLKKELDKAVQKQIEMDGIEVQVQQRKAETDRSFEEVKNSVIELYKKFVAEEHASLNDIAYVIQKQMQGVKISEANESYYDQLLVIETFMLGLE